MRNCIQHSVVLGVVVALGLSGCGRGPAAKAEPTVEEQALLQKLAVLHREGRFDEGLAESLQYLQLEPGASEVHHAVAVFQGSLGQHHAAIGSFEKELELNPEHLASHLGLCQTYEALGQYEKALQYGEEALRVSPENPRVFFQVGSLLSTLGRFEEAEDYLLKARLTLDSPVLDTELAMVSQRRGDTEIAVRRFRQALARDPQYLPALSGLAQGLLKMGQEVEGKELLAYHQRLAELIQRRSGLEPACRSLNGVVASCIELARVHLMLGHDEPARVAFEMALDIDHESFVAALGLGALSLRLGDLDLASKWTVQALALAPDHPRPLFQLGLLRVHKGEYEAAETVLKRSHEAGRWTEEFYLHLGDAWLKVGEHERARQSYQEGLKLAADHKDLLLGNGRCQMMSGNLAGAERSFTELVEVQPNYQPAWLLLSVTRKTLGDQDGARSAFKAAVQAADSIYSPETAKRQLLGELNEIPGGDGAAEFLRSVPV